MVEGGALQNEIIEQRTQRGHRLLDSAVAQWLHVTSQTSHEYIPHFGSCIHGALDAFVVEPRCSQAGSARARERLRGWV